MTLSIWKLWKEKEKNQQNIEYLKNVKSFLEEIKTIFYNFWNTFLWKNIKKTEDTSFKVEYSDSY